MRYHLFLNSFEKVVKVYTSCTAYCDLYVNDIILSPFSVLVDTRDREGAQTTYVVQENIEVIKSSKVLHPKIDDHFEAYDGSQYLPRPWLRELYPLD